MNTVPCKNCGNFEQSEKYRGGKRADVWYGWCKARSVYPAQEWDAARPFDVDVTRVTERGQRSKPFIVESAETLPSCTFVVAK